MSLRRATLEDVPRLLAIEAQWATTPHWTAEHFNREVASERGLGLVAEEQGRVVGYGFLWMLPGEGQGPADVDRPGLRAIAIPAEIGQILFAEHA